MQLHIINKRTVLVVVGLLLAYLVSRLLLLTALPIFTDEAIYLRWAQIGGNDPAWRFISLTDGKQPLFTWLAMISLRFFSDPLLGGRLVSVLAGIGSMIGLMVLAYELFRSGRISIIAAILYIISPFALMYDRLALYDSLSTAFAIWSCFLAIRMTRSLRFDVAMLYGVSLGLGMINKSSGFLSLYLFPLTLLVLQLPKKKPFQTIVRWVLLALLAAGISQAIYVVLRLSPFYYLIGQKDSIFVHPFSAIFTIYPSFIGNLRGLFDWFIHYLTVPIILAMVPALVIKGKEWKSIGLLLAWSLAPMFALGYFGKVLYPRYILFMVIPLLILTSITIDWLITRWKGQWRLYVLVMAIGFFAVRASYYILFQPVYAPIPAADRGQLIDDWPSGWGVPEVNELLTKELAKGEVAVFTDGTFGLLPYAIEIYHARNTNLFIKGVWPMPKDMPEEIIEQARSKPTYIIMNQTRSNLEGWPVELIATYQKGNNPSVSLRIFLVKPITSYALHQ